jgi:hypothetical protein
MVRRLLNKPFECFIGQMQVAISVSQILDFGDLSDEISSIQQPKIIAD